MKKIIYSLVAMLFMGSIFTSCLEQTELPGLYQVRLSQAGYLDALAELKKADATYRQAEATVQLSIAEMNKAVAAKRQAEAESLKALADIEKAKAEYTEAEYQAKIDSLLDKMAEDELVHQKNMADKQAALAKAQKDLADALAKIDLESLALTDAQLTVINGYKDKYDEAAAKLNKLLDTMLYAENSNNLYDALYDAIEGQATAEYAQELLEEELAYFERQLAYSEQAAAYWKELLNDFETDYLAEAAAFQAIADEAAAAKAEHIRDLVIYENVNGPIRDAAIEEATDAYKEAIKEPLATLNEAVKNIKGDDGTRLTLTGITKTSGKITAVEANAKAKAVDVNYGITLAKALPAHTPGDLITTYENYLNARWYGYINTDNDKVVFEPKDEDNERDTIRIFIADKSKKAAYTAMVDTIWSMGQSTTANSENPRVGIWTAYEDFGRDYLYSAKAESMKDDAEMIQAYITKKKAEYDSILGILEDAPAHYADTLMMAWYREAMGYQTAIMGAQAKLSNTTSGYLKKGVYTVTSENDDQAWSAKQPIVFSVKKPVKVLMVSAGDPTVIEITSSLNEVFNTYAYEDHVSPYDEPGPQYYDLDLMYAPTAQDTATVFNAIVDYFKAIAAIDVKAVPYLKFVQFNSNGYAYMDSVRADLMSIAGLELKPSNALLVGDNIRKVATYDNKGLVPNESGQFPTASDVREYEDALKKVINLYNAYIAENGGYAHSSLPAYFRYVNEYKIFNVDAEKKTFQNYTEKPFSVTADTTWLETEFAKQSKKSESGKALAAWMNANKTYFGVEGFAGFGEKVFFDYETFTDPSNVVLFTGVDTDDPYYKTADKQAIKNMGEAYIYHFSKQYGFVLESIYNKMALQNTSALGADYYASNYVHTPEVLPDGFAIDLEEKSLVFEILKAEFVYALATGAASESDAWTALEDVLKEVKVALDEVVTKQDTEAAGRATDAANYNAAIKAYLDAEKAAKKVKDDAIDAANDAYDEGLEEITDQLDLLDEIIEFNENMAYDLMAAYDLYSLKDLGNDDDTVGIEEYLWEQYEDAIEECEFWATSVDTIKFYLGELENEDADMYALAIAAIQAIQGEISDAEIADAMFWYEYWKAAYEAALALIMPEE